MKERYNEAIAKSEIRFRNILEGKDEFPVDEIKQRRDFLSSVNLNKAYLRLWLSLNKNTLAAAAVILILLTVSIFVPFRTKLEKGVHFAQKVEIQPVDGAIKLKLSSGEIVSLDSFERSLDSSEALQGLKIDNSNGVIQYISEDITSSDVKERTGDELTSDFESDVSRFSEEKMKQEFSENEFNELYIPKGRSYSVILSDGSKVWVNAESSVRYPVSFSSSERRVSVSGEAYFEVKNDNARPFIVETGNYDVRVLGTSFNISAYEEDDYTATTLVSGSVSVSSDDKEYLIRPGEQLSFDKKSNSAEIKEVDVELYTLWKENLLKLDHMPVEELFKILKRRYDIEVYYTRAEIKSKTFSGKIPLNDDLNIVLNQLSTVSNITFDIENRLIVVRYKD
jgi:hypothetical protein